MKTNLIIHTPEKIEREVEDFKLDSFEDGQNYSVAKIKVTRDIKTEKPVIWYSQELVRNHREANDPFNKRQILKPFTSSNLEAVSDETLTQKFKDTVLAYKGAIQDYAPLTDVHSNKMKVFVDEDSAQFVEDIGISIDGLGCDFSEIESVQANPFYEDIAGDARAVKNKLNVAKSQLSQIKELIVDEFDKYVDPKRLTSDEFASKMALENIPTGLIQRYLEIIETIHIYKSKLGEVNKEVYNETAQKIKLPERIKGNINDIF